jgi:hypothetical protein
MTNPPEAPTSARPPAQEAALQRRQAWVNAYVIKTSPLLSTLALIYLVTWSIKIIWPEPHTLWFSALTWFGFGLWVLFALDLVLRFAMETERRGFFKRNWLDTITVVIPQFRALRVLRIFTKHGLLSKKKGLISGGALATALLATVLILWVGSLMVLDVERGAAGAQITTLQTALWWAVQTVTTVGYGDVVPVTLAGQGLAVLVMLVGISVVGSVSASFAATLIKQKPTGTPDTPPPADTSVDVSNLLAELTSLKAMVGDLQTKLAAWESERSTPST